MTLNDSRTALRRQGPNEVETQMAVLADQDDDIGSVSQQQQQQQQQLVHRDSTQDFESFQAWVRRWVLLLVKN